MIEDVPAVNTSADVVFEAKKDSDEPIIDIEEPIKQVPVVEVVK